MTSYEELWGVAEDNHGIVTSKQAVELGISRQCVRALVDTGKLIRLGHGVYQVTHHVPAEIDAYASAAALVGSGGYVRGASVLAMFKLCPTNPSFMYVGSASRARRSLPEGYILRDRHPTETFIYDNVPFQTIPCALREARTEGTVESDRIAEAALVANEKGLISDAEAAEFQG